MPAKKKTTSKTTDPVASLVTGIRKAIVDGELDGHLGSIDDALTERMNAQNAAAKKAAAKSASKEKKVPPAPKRKTLAVEPGKTYQISKGNERISGAKVKFLKFKAETDEQKLIVELLEDRPGAPKGKKIVIPAGTLKEYEKKTAAKRTVKKKKD